MHGAVTNRAGDYLLMWISGRTLAELDIGLSYFNEGRDFSKRCDKGLQPCFIIKFDTAYYGTEMAVFGAVNIQDAVQNIDGFSLLDRLTPSLSLDFEPDNIDLPAMAQVAKMLKALKHALNHLEKYYEDPQPEILPCLHTYIGMEKLKKLLKSRTQVK